MRRLLDPALVRARDRRFWFVQALVLLITSLHHYVEAMDPQLRHDALAFVPVTLYLIPALYAGLNFGVAGALPTALLGAVLSLTNTFVWHDAHTRVGESLQMSIIVAVAVLVARRVDRETRAKQRAEEMSADLAELNATAAAANGSLEPCRVVQDTLDAVVQRGRARAAWVMLAPAMPAAPDLTARSGTPPRSIPLSDTWLAWTRRVMEEGRPVIDRGGCPAGACVCPPARCAVAIVPIRAAGQSLGALGVAGHACPVSAPDLALLEAIADQLAVGLENTRHYQEERRALAQLRVAQEQLQAYLRFAVEAQEEERKRLARELHDDTIQSLVVAKGRLDDLGAGARLSPAARRQLDGLKALLDQAVDDIRRFCRDLRPSLLDDLGLVHAVDWLVTDMATRTSVAARLDVDGEPERWPGGTEVALFRIVQEALHNVERHAAAESVTVMLAYATDRVTATIRDDGRGFDAAAALATRGGDAGMGLLGMRERARLIGGALTITSEAGVGTTVTVVAPRSAGPPPCRPTASS